MKCRAIHNTALTYRSAASAEKQVHFAEGEEIPLLISQGPVDYFILREQFNEAMAKGAIDVEQVCYKVEGVEVAGEGTNENGDAFRQLFSVPYSFDDLEYYASEIGYIYQVNREQFDEFVDLIEEDFE